MELLALQKREFHRITIQAQGGFMCSAWMAVVIVTALFQLALIFATGKSHSVHKYERSTREYHTCEPESPSITRITFACLRRSSAHVMIEKPVGRLLALGG